MSSVINTNVKALTAQGSLNTVNNKMSQAMQRLSTGLRINSAKDDAAGLAITNKMTADIRGLAVAIRNANDGLSMAQTAEGAISSINGMLQRMRELAVQSANGTSSDLARKGSQLEIEQLKQEINNIAARTSFNGINLLDGSAAKLVLQTGSESGQTMVMQLDSVNTSSIGVGSRPSLSTVGANQATDALLLSKNTMRSGDLIINGVSVTGSVSGTDNLSYGGKSASSISKAAAINLVSDQSGVKAVVNETYVAGTAMTSAHNNTSGTVTINGVAISVTTASDLGVTRGRVVTAINAYSNQTGVVAEDTGDDKNGVILKAKDGRNISVQVATVDAADLGLTSGSSIGTYSLQSLTGQPIVLSSTWTGDISRAGLTAGSYAANSSVMSTGQRKTLTAAPTASEQWGAGTLKINGVAIAGTDPASDSASDEKATSSKRGQSAIAIAAAINKSSADTGVKAVVQKNTIVGGSFSALAGGLAAKNLWINGVSVDLTSLSTSSYTLNDLATTINAVSGQTGVVAKDTGTGLSLTAADGRNISLGSDEAAASFGLVASIDGQSVINTSATTAADGYTTYAQIALMSDKQFSVTSGSDGKAVLELLKFSSGTFGGESNGFKVSDVDISTQSGGSAALAALDAALDSVNFTQSRLGALQNRLDTAISNLSEVSRNTSESRSRILDADYATETTNLAKAQIVQQAATAMLAQANQSAQSVLSLLK